MWWKEKYPKQNRRLITHRYCRNMTHIRINKFTDEMHSKKKIVFESENYNGAIPRVGEKLWWREDNEEDANYNGEVLSVNVVPEDNFVWVVLSFN